MSEGRLSTPPTCYRRRRVWSPGDERDVNSLETLARVTATKYGCLVMGWLRRHLQRRAAMDAPNGSPLDSGRDRCAGARSALRQEWKEASDKCAQHGDDLFGRNLSFGILWGPEAPFPRAETESAPHAPSAGWRAARDLSRSASAPLTPPARTLPTSRCELARLVRQRRSRQSTLRGEHSVGKAAATAERYGAFLHCSAVSEGNTRLEATIGTGRILRALGGPCPRPACTKFVGYWLPLILMLVPGPRVTKSCEFPPM